MKLILQTERLILRPFEPSDAPHVRALANHFDIAKMVASFPYPYPEGLAEHWIAGHDAQRAAGKGYPFAIEADGALIGSVGFEDEGNGEFELGYWLGTEHWGQGYGTEAARAVVQYGFDWRVAPYMRASFITNNRASARLLAKLGFLATHRYRAHHKVRAEEVEITRAVLLRDAFIRDDSHAKKVYKAA